MRTSILVAALIAALAGCGEPVIGAAEVNTRRGRTRDVNEARALVRELRAGDRGERIAAARSMARDSYPDARETVTEALAGAASDEDPWVRRWAVAALGTRDRVAVIAVPALVPALDDVLPAIREAAALSLGRLGRPARAGTGALARLADEDGDRVARMAAWALRSMDFSLPEVSGARPQDWDHEEECVVIRVDRESCIVVKRRPYTIEELAEFLSSRADTARADRPPYASKIIIYLGLDEDLAWGVGQAVLGLLDRPEIRIERVELAVRRAESGRLGRLRVALARHGIDSNEVNRVDVRAAATDRVGEVLRRIAALEAAGQTPVIEAPR